MDLIYVMLWLKCTQRARMRISRSHIMHMGSETFKTTALMVQLLSKGNFYLFYTVIVCMHLLLLLMIMAIRLCMAEAFKIPWILTININYYSAYTITEQQKSHLRSSFNGASSVGGGLGSWMKIWELELCHATTVGPLCKAFKCVGVIGLFKALSSSLCFTVGVTHPRRHSG